MWIWKGLFLRKNYVLRFWGWLSLPNWIRVLTLSLLLKLHPRKLEPWFILWSFSFQGFSLLSLKIYHTAMYGILLSCLGGARSCYLELLDKLPKRICRTVGPSLAASCEPLAHCRNVASLSLFYRYYFGRCSSELTQMVAPPYSQGRSSRYSDRLHDFFVTIPTCYKDVYVNGFFPCTARLWNSLPTKCFPLTYVLSCFKSRISRHLLTAGSLKTYFLHALTFLSFFFS